jgi:glutamate N-acetyltransferase/amino-acid N-acetyltransferase
MVSPALLRSALKRAIDRSYNRVSVDGDTSTNDTVVVLANGASGVKPSVKAFEAALTDVLESLAQQIARDGEGARKLVTIDVEGAANEKTAEKIARAIANSPLVKTAIAGEDANWGRVVMAVGKAGEPANRDKLSISFNGIRVASRGARDPSYNETEVSAAMKNPKIQIKIALGLGKGRDRVLTCDLTKEYVAINGDYRS